MADYRQLLIKAIDALSENNGAQRREVYEKARKALVAQLRSITPPLPAREITQHRLELEDCIRQVEQEATENILGGLKKLDEEPAAIPPEPKPSAPPAPTPSSPEPTPAAAEPAAPKPVADTPDAAGPEPEKAGPVQPDPAPEPEAEAEPGVEADTVAELASALEGDSSPPEDPAPQADSEPADAGDDISSIDAIIARAEAARAHNPLVDSSPSKPAPAPEPVPEPVETAGPVAPKSTSQPAPQPPAGAAAASASPSAVVEAPASSSVSGRAVGAAMSQVREVEVEFDAPKVEELEQHDDSQEAIDRAIEMLDREARGESSDDIETAEPEDEDPGTAASRPDDPVLAGENRFMSNSDDEKGGNALTIFLVLAVLLLAGAGGAGYWAWREGYVDLDALFAQSTVVTTPQTDGAEDETPADGVPASSEDGPGNTETDAPSQTPTESLTTEEQSGAEDRLPGAGSEDPPAATTGEDADKVEDRLTTDTPSATEAPIDSTAPAGETAAPDAAQSLLLEASADGTTGAVPYSGTVSWRREADELGQPTLVGTANIPARNLGVTVLIRRNADPTLPASHLVEIQFETNETFVGGSIASFGGILLKNEELVPGRPLVGAPARVFENMFLFALSSAEPDVRTNLPLLENNKWLDLAIIYGTGRQAIITLEKDDAAQTMFDEVLAVWAEADQADASDASSSQ